jgi:hypothetical protein
MLQVIAVKATLSPVLNVVAINKIVINFGSQSNSLGESPASPIYNFLTGTVGG